MRSLIRFPGLVERRGRDPGPSKPCPLPLRAPETRQVPYGFPSGQQESEFDSRLDQPFVPLEKASMATLGEGQQAVTASSGLGKSMQGARFVGVASVARREAGGAAN